MNLKKTLICSILIFCFISNLNAANDSTKIYFGLYVKNIILSDKSNVFNADIYWWLRYPMPKDTALVHEIENIEFVNAENQDNSIDDRHTFYDSSLKKTFVYITGHLKGDFFFYAKYEHYPFDKLILPFNIESKNLTSNVFHLIADTTSYDKSTSRILGVANDIELPNFQIKGSKYVSGEKNYETNFGDVRFSSHLNYSRISFLVVVERKSTTFLLKILVPIILITLMAYLVFFVPPSNLEVAVGLTVTSLLACIALQLNIGNDIPSTGYLISSDKIFYLSYTLITFAMIQTVLNYNFEKSGKKKLARKLEIISRFVYPSIFIVGLMVIIIKAILASP